MSPNLTGLRHGLKKMVIEECNVEGVAPEQIADGDQLIGGQGALRLDSLDALEIVAAVERNFGFRMQNSGDSREAFRSFTAMGDYILARGDQEKISAFAARNETK